MDKKLLQVHDALLDILSTFNSPEREVRQLRDAGVELDRALFPLLIRIQRRESISVGDLADWVGRDHTTISRQVAKLEKLGLVTRRDAAADLRVRETLLTDAGQHMADKLEVANYRMATGIFSEWTDEELSELLIMLRRMANDSMRWFGIESRLTSNCSDPSG